MAGRVAKRTKSLGSRVLHKHFDLVVILGSFGLLVLKWPVTRTWLVIEK